MNYRMVFSMIGRLLLLEAGLLLFPAACSAIYGESSVWALLMAAGVTPSRRASSFWLMPSSSRRCFSLCPTLMADPSFELSKGIIP